MKKLLIILTLLSNYCIYSQIQRQAQVQATSVNVSSTTIQQRELVLSEPSTIVNVPLQVDLNNYEKLLLVDIKSIGLSTEKYLYNLYEERLLSSPLKIVNPVKFDKKKFKKNRMFLRDIKDPKSLYFYYVRSQGSAGNDDIITTVIIRDYQNKVIYSVTHKNMGFNEILLPITGF